MCIRDRYCTVQSAAPERTCISLLCGLHCEEKLRPDATELSMSNVSHVVHSAYKYIWPYLLYMLRTHAYFDMIFRKPTVILLIRTWRCVVLLFEDSSGRSTRCNPQPYQSSLLNVTRQCGCGGGGVALGISEHFALGISEHWEHFLCSTQCSHKSGSPQPTLWSLTKVRT